MQTPTDKQTRRGTRPAS